MAVRSTVLRTRGRMMSSAMSPAQLAPMRSVWLAEVSVSVPLPVTSAVPFRRI